MIEWKSYLTKGFLKPQRPNFIQIDRQLQRAGKDLKTLAVVIKTDPEWASTIAYQAMLRAGRALIFAYGYLPTDGQQHKTVVEVTGKLLGADFGLLIKYFNRMRRRRNTFFYDSIGDENTAQAKKALKTATALLKAIKNKIKDNNPQYNFL